MNTKILISEKQIAARVKEIGEEISRDFSEKELVFVGVLNGAFIFLADLVRATSIDSEIGFMQVSSYGNGMISGKLTVKHHLETEISGKCVILVEDIIDSGRSVHFLNDYLIEKGATSVSVAVLLNKPKAHKVEIKPDYIGFNISNEFVIGYGLDLAGKKRNLPAVYQVIEE